MGPKLCQGSRLQLLSEAWLPIIFISVAFITAKSSLFYFDGGLKLIPVQSFFAIDVFQLQPATSSKSLCLSF